MKKDTTSFSIAKPWKRFIARFFDFIFASLIPFIVSIVISSINKVIANLPWVLVLIIILNLILLFLYFIIVPWLWNGQTLGKKILRIKVINQNGPIKLLPLIYREFFIIFIPMFLLSLILIICSFVAKTSLANLNLDNNDNYILKVFVRVFFSFIFAWYLGIMITVKIDQQHQLFFDRKNDFCVVNTKILNKQEINQLKKTKLLVHAHLKTNMPGNIDDEQLTEIKKLKD